jgi:hypothetical protein
MGRTDRSLIPHLHKGLFFVTERIQLTKYEETISDCCYLSNNNFLQQ